MGTVNQISTATHLRSTPNIAVRCKQSESKKSKMTGNFFDSPPISVCFTVGCSSAYRHIRRRSASVRVFLGVVVLRPVAGGADSGDDTGGAGEGTWADANMDDTYVD